MATVRAYAKQSLASGDYNSSEMVSIFGTPGSGSNLRGYYRCDISVHMVLDDDLALWLAPAGGQISAGTKIGSNRADWIPMMWSYPDRFLLEWLVGNNYPQAYSADASWNKVENISAAKVFEGHTASGSSGGTSGSVWHEVPDYGAATVGQAVPSSYVKVNANLATSGSDPVTRTAWTWLCGVVSYGAPDNDSIWIPSQMVQITASEIVDELFDYYPWGKYDSAWLSLNREGGSLKRRAESAWADVKNSRGSGTSKGFRHDGSAWAKSPITGRE